MARSAKFVLRRTAKFSRRNDLSPFPIFRAALLGVVCDSTTGVPISAVLNPSPQASVR